MREDGVELCAVSWLGRDAVGYQSRRLSHSWCLKGYRKFPDWKGGVGDEQQETKGEIGGCKEGKRNGETT